MSKREFSVANEYHYDRSSPVRWIIAHLFRYKRLVISFILLSMTTNILFSAIKVLVGVAFNVVQQGEARSLGIVAMSILTIVGVGSLINMGARLSSALLSTRFVRDARDELYLSLLGKSQTFHNRHRVGDIMARAANDVDQLGSMVAPGLDVTIESLGSLMVTFIFIAILDPQLLAVPFLYTVCFILALRLYQRQLDPVMAQIRRAFGETNAAVTEAVTGIEVVKATAQEQREQQQFTTLATHYRDCFIQAGVIEGCYFPTLMLGVFLALAFLHGIYLFSQEQIAIGTLVAFMALMNNLRHVTDMFSFCFRVVQSGVASANRIQEIMEEESELDENELGHRTTIHGDIVFGSVSFDYPSKPVLKEISFHVRPGQTIAIVGQVGSGKSTLTKLINRIYDVSAGRILIDGVDVHNWNLDVLRSQISTIEQDIFLFARTIAENIAYGLGPRADRKAIEAAAKEAQAHDFIMSFKDGYETIIGERGITLSGGQRQRIAIARALLTDPRILILDDSTSAIDSATEDAIQKAIRRVRRGRTTFLITHRLSQIRAADSILVLNDGELLDQGTHDELLVRCDMYRRIFAPYAATMPVAISDVGIA